MGFLFPLDQPLCPLSAGKLASTCAGARSKLPVAAASSRRYGSSLDYQARFLLNVRYHPTIARGLVIDMAPLIKIRSQYQSGSILIQSPA